MASSIIKFAEANEQLQLKAKAKYLDDPITSLVKIPAYNGSELSHAIDVWHQNHHYLLMVTEEELRNMHWDAYLEISDDGEYLPYYGDLDDSDYMDNDNYY